MIITLAGIQRILNATPSQDRVERLLSLNIPGMDKVKASDLVQDFESQRRSAESIRKEREERKRISDQKFQQMLAKIEARRSNSEAAKEVITHDH